MSTAPTPADILQRIQHVQADTAGVMEASRWVEWILANRLNAQGTGIHSRVNGVQHLLAADLVADLRYLAAVRNDFAHNPLAAVRQPDRFVDTAQRAVRRLLEMPLPAARAAAPAAPPGQRLHFVAVAAGFWALAVIAFWLYGQTQARASGGEPLPPPLPPQAATAPPAAARAEPRPAPPARPSAVAPTRAAETRSAGAAPARPATGTATPAAAAGDAPRAEAAAGEATLSVEELRKLKSSF